MLVLPERKRLEWRARFRCVRGMWCIVQRFWESCRLTSTPFLRDTISLSELKQSGGKKKGEICDYALAYQIYTVYYFFSFFWKKEIVIFFLVQKRNCIIRVFFANSIPTPKFVFYLSFFCKLYLNLFIIIIIRGGKINLGWRENYGYL
jgi:hypothetical protein